MTEVPDVHTSLSRIPNTPAVYAMYAGGQRFYVAYVGIAERLKQRLTQHLVRKDSSVVTGVSAVSLNPDLVTEIRWWQAPEFAERSVLEAAELVAFDVLEPVLRSRGGITGNAEQLALDSSFRERMIALFTGEPTGLYAVQNVQILMERIARLEERIAKLEAEVRR